jgi:hypothetical protein
VHYSWHDQVVLLEEGRANNLSSFLLRLLLLLLLLQVEEPAKRKAGVMVSSVAELVKKLHEEAKVI